MSNVQNGMSNLMGKRESVMARSKMSIRGKLVQTFLVAVMTVVFGVAGFVASAEAAITTLNAWTQVSTGQPVVAGGSVGTFTVSTGSNSNRVLVVTHAGESNATYDLSTSTATYGTAAMTRVVQSSSAAGTTFRNSIIFICNEACLDAASNTTISIIPDPSNIDIVTDQATHAAAYDGVDQATPFTNTLGVGFDYGGANAANLNADDNGGVTLAVGDQYIYSLMCNTGSLAITAATGFTEALQSNTASASFATGYRNTTTAATVSGDSSAAIYPADRCGVTAFGLKPSASGSTTTLGNGTNPANATLAPNAAATNLDAFTLQTSAGTDTVTAATVTLAPANAFNNIGRVELTNAAGTTVYGTVNNPASNTVSFTGMTLPVTTTLTTFYVRVTPKTHALMPAVATGASFATTGTVTAYTCTNPKAGTDTGSATLTIDNLSPAAATSFSGTAGNAQVNLSWTNPLDTDFSQVVVLRNLAAFTTQIPVEGQTYNATNPIGTATVVYAGNATTHNDTTVTNGTGYFYKIYSKDSNGNYSAVGTTAGPYTPTGPVTTVGTGTNPAPAYLAPGGVITSMNAFTLATTTGTDTVTAVTLAMTGGGATNAFSGLAQIAITNNAGTTTYGVLNNPASDTPTVTLTTNITATTTVTQYLVRITPKSHVNMPVPPGELYTVSGTVSALTSANTKSYSDTGSAVIEIDNASTDVVTIGTVTPGNTNVDISWANPLDLDLDPTNSVVVLRKAASAVTEKPVEGVAYTVGTVVGGAVVAYNGAVEGFVDTGLTNFTNYYYAIFAKDSNGNYSLAATTGPHQPWVPVCVANEPTLIVSPATRNAIPTDVAKYTVSVTNNDNSLCAPTNFTVSLTDSNSVDFDTPSTLNGTPTSTVLNIAYGQTKQAQLVVTVDGLATLGNFNVTTISVSAAGHTAPPAVTATTTAANPLMHNSINTGSTKWNAEGGWGVTGGRYGTFNCFICHEESVVGADGTPNVKKVREVIPMPADGRGNGYFWPNGTYNTPTITFADTRAGSSEYVETNGAHTSSNKICEVCHTYQGGAEPNNSGVRYHGYNMTGSTVDEQNHNSLGDCLGCHPHTGGFKAQGCTACHGFPIDIAADLSIAPVTGAGSIGAHPKHQAEAFDCDYCHGPGATISGGSGGLHATGAIAINFDGGTSFTLAEASDGLYNGHSEITAGYTGNDAGTVNNSRSCANIYCHGGTLYPAMADPTWLAGAQACGTCHNDTAADASWLGSHSAHLNAVSLDCSACHGAGYSAGTTKPAGHTNGKVKIDLGAYGTYSKVANGGEVITQSLTGAAAYGTCSVNCHGAGTPQWGVAFPAYPAKCVQCHNDGDGGTTLADAVPAASKVIHRTHINANNLYVTNDCDACHGTGATNGTHANHTDGAYPNGTATYANELSVYSTGNKNCTNTCHIATSSNMWIEPTPPALACLDCHTSTYIGGSALPTSGLHNMSAAGVQKHDATLTDGVAGNGVGCGECHVTEPATHLNGSFSADALNNTDRWVTRANMTYTQVTPAGGNSGTCSGTGLAGACHSDGGNWARRWSTEANQADTVTAASSAKCNVCHGVWNSWAVGTTHYKANNSASSTKGNGHETTPTVTCDNCHAYTSVTGNHDTATHRITMNSNGTGYARNGAVYGTSRAGCTTCHGGAGNASYDFAISYFTQNTVPGGPAIPMPACNSCHDDATKAATVPQVKIGTTANSSSSHVDADGTGVAKTINVAGATAKCEDCHAGHADGVSGANDVEIPTNYSGGAVPTMNWQYASHGNKIKLGGTSTSGSTEAEMCWNCHNSVGVSEWRVNSNTKTGSIAYDYGALYTDLSTVPGTTTTNWTTGFWRSGKGLTSGSTSNPFWYKRGAIQSTHSVNFDSGVVTVTTGNSLGFGRTETKDAVANIRCTYCHDVHGTHNGINNDTSGGTGTADQPYLRGTWTGNQYDEDGAPQWGMLNTWTVQAESGGTTMYGRVPRASANPNNTGLNNAVYTTQNAGGWWIDQNSNNPTGITTASSEAARLTVANNTSGLCEQCHGVNKTGVWTTNAIGNLNWSTNGVGEANNWIWGYNGHANSVVGGSGRGANGSAEARGRNLYTRVARGTAYFIATDSNSGANDMGAATQGNTGGRGYTYRSSTSNTGTGYGWFPKVGTVTATASPAVVNSAFRYFAWSTAFTTSTRNSLWATGTLMLGMTNAQTEATHDAQISYHTFTCAKCHNPHASRLPKLMITNCLDTNHNTWEDNTAFTGRALPTIWANTRHSQWATAINCHRLDARAAQTTGQVITLGRGWNRVTPWLEFTNPNSTRTNPNP